MFHIQETKRLGLQLYLVMRGNEEVASFHSEYLARVRIMYLINKNRKIETTEVH